MLGRTIEGLEIDGKAVRLMDRDRSGTISFFELMHYLFPQVPRLDLSRICQTKITAKGLVILRQQFEKVATNGYLDPQKLQGKRTFVQGTELQALDFARIGRHITFSQFLQVLYPNVDLKEIHRLTTPTIPEREYFRLKYAFQKLDVDQTGFVTVEHFNRSERAQATTWADGLRQTRYAQSNHRRAGQASAFSSGSRSHS